MAAIVTRDDVLTLFGWFADVYGNRWNPRPEAVDTWARSLQAFTRADLRRACELVLREYQDWPPSLPAFCQCIRARKVRKPAQEPVQEPVRKLSGSEAATVRKVRAMLRRGPLSDAEWRILYDATHDKRLREYMRANRPELGV